MISAIFIAINFFILVHAGTVFLANMVPGMAWLGNDVLRLDRDRSVVEVFGYLLVLVTVSLLTRAFVLSGQGVHLAWAAVYAFVVFDDALLLHEHFGGHLGTALSLPRLFGLRPQDLGELMVWAAAAALLAPLLAWGFMTSTRAAVRHGLLLAAIFALLVTSAVALDMIHILVAPWSRFADAALVIAEDGGEMAALGLACAYALLLDRHLSGQRTARSPLTRREVRVPRGG